MSIFKKILYVKEYHKSMSITQIILMKKNRLLSILCVAIKLPKLC